MNELLDERGKNVVKHNRLIRDTRYTLSEKEQKILIYIISKIPHFMDRSKEKLEPITIDVKEYCEVAGISWNGKNMNDVKGSIKALADKSWWVEVDSPGEEDLFRWIANAKIVKGKNIVIKLSDALEPFLIKMTRDFTKYELINVLILHGKYAIRLYELLKSYRFRGFWEVDLGDLRKQINCDSYEKYKEFRRNVLDPSLKEINTYTDLMVTYSTEREGRKIKRIIFDIDEKEGVQMVMPVLEQQANRLGEPVF